MILIIDDDAAVRSSLTFLLKRAGFRPEAVPGPKEALEVVRATAPELILMDMNFTLTTTGEEGIQLLRQVKIFRPDVPVILMTAWGSISLAVQGMQAGAFDFITKPWNNLVLLKSIRTALELSEQKKETNAPLNRSDADHKFHFDKIVGQSAALMDIRVVSATNRDLRSMVADRTFREDLFYRINLITVHLPALRERREDIPLLARYFADKQSEINGLPRVEFSSDAQTYLSRLPFPGNIRELKNLVERTILVSGKTLLDAADFEVHCMNTSGAKSTIPPSLEGLTLDELEKQTILRSLEAHGGNLSHVATALGISRAALYRRLEKYGIPVDK